MEVLAVSAEAATVSGLHIPIVCCAGEVTWGHEHIVETRLDQAMRDDARVVILSLAETTRVDNTGVRMLLRAHERLDIRTQRLLIVAPRGTSPHRTLEITGLATVCPIFESLSDALAWVNSTFPTDED